MDSSTTDPVTLAYLDRLPLLFSPLPPPFSSSASHSIASRRPTGLGSNDLTTRCHTCRAEVIGGINGSYWTDRGELWLRCERCGWATRRKEDKEAVRGGREFESVKKRRKERERSRKEANSHPTQFRATTTSRTQDKSQNDNRPSKVKSESPLPTARLASTPASTLPHSLSRNPSSVAAVATTNLTTVSLPDAPSHPVSAPSPSVSTSAQILDSKLAAPSAKKRKRSKQPNGLAELLAKKKKDEGGAGGSSGNGGGLGLQDFLQGL
ncbi:uncharacterized protein JCM6883_007196 [Sporobolomyces salmoneus]|uniref:uncharacterized protein n=1 Tax=Sporobolomyces salmoneus TaxID=183962 RepID=UPI0031812FDE